MGEHWLACRDRVVGLLAATSWVFPSSLYLS